VGTNGKLAGISYTLVTQPQPTAEPAPKRPRRGQPKKSDEPQGEQIFIESQDNYDAYLHLPMPRPRLDIQVDLQRMSRAKKERFKRDQVVKDPKGYNARVGVPSAGKKNATTVNLGLRLEKSVKRALEECFPGRNIEGLMSAIAVRAAVVTCTCGGEVRSRAGAGRMTQATAFTLHIQGCDAFAAAAVRYNVCDTAASVTASFKKYRALVLEEATKKKQDKESKMEKEREKTEEECEEEEEEEEEEANEVVQQENTADGGRLRLLAAFAGVETTTATNP